MLKRCIRKIEGRHQHKGEIIRMRKMLKDTEKYENDRKILKKRWRKPNRTNRERKHLRLSKSRFNFLKKICKPTRLTDQQAAICSWLLSLVNHEGLPQNETLFRPCLWHGLCRLSSAHLNDVTSQSHSGSGSDWSLILISWRACENQMSRLWPRVSYSVDLGSPGNLYF